MNGIEARDFGPATDLLSPVEARFSVLTAS
jgi:hypothetical protein